MTYAKTYFLIVTHTALCHHNFSLEGSRVGEQSSCWAVQLPSKLVRQAGSSLIMAAMSEKEEGELSEEGELVEQGQPEVWRMLQLPCMLQVQSRPCLEAVVADEDLWLHATCLLLLLIGAMLAAGVGTCPAPGRSQSHHCSPCLACTGGAASS